MSLEIHETFQMDAEYDTGKVTGINNGEGPDKDWEFLKKETIKLSSGNFNYEVNKWQLLFSDERQEHQMVQIVPARSKFRAHLISIYSKW